MISRDRLTLAAYLLLFGALAALFITKPAVDNDHHAAYQRNLETLDSQLAVLQREQRNVTLGITRHYDFLEAAMQSLEKGAGLVALAPAFVPNDYRDRVDGGMRAYRAKLADLRREVDTTKRVVGLLRNSRNAVERLIGSAAQSFAEQGKVPATLLDLERATARGTPATVDTAALAGWPQIAQLKMHVDVVQHLAPQLEQVSNRLQRLIGDANEPAALRDAYLDHYYAAMRATQRAMLASYGIAALLLLLSLLQVRQARQARSESDAARLEAEQARLDSDAARTEAEGLGREAERARTEAEALAARVAAQLDETHRAVAACNAVLHRVGDGEAGQRVTLTLDGDLGELCKGVNRAAECVEETLDEIERVMLAIRDGRLDVQVSASLRGRVGASVSAAMRFLDDTLNGIRSAIENLAQGQFSARVEVEARGDLARLKDGINASMAALAAAIASINAVVVAQSNGDLTQRVANDFPGDLAVLAGAVNRSADMLCEMMNAARAAAHAVHGAAGEVSHSAGSVTEAAQSQLSALASTRAGADAVAAGIVQSATALTAAGRLALEAKQRADEGEVVLDKAQHSMNSIIESSRKIENIVGLIESIAFQTNLLALNAAVEAARAQEHGRGFAVVAGEVRLLAQQSADASSSIKKLIQASVEEVERGARDVHATGEAFESISGVVEQVNALFADIRASSEAQEASVKRVNGHVQDLDHLSQHSLSLAENNLESAAALVDNAKRLQTMLARFSTEPAARGPALRRVG
ncbi:MAG: methyl-accepting chemotaxis protein [Gammaproteobacteria bacterium]